jgi:sodium-dependent dicarboxylate transporter 2/3/5
MRSAKSLFQTLYSYAAFVAGILLFLLVLWFKPFGLSAQAVKVLAVAVLMIIWWITEAMPMPAVALLPLVLFPLFQIAPIKEVAASYGDSIIFLFMGGFFIGLAIEKWNLHKRIALNIVRITGTSGDRIVLGFILATGFLSMWLSNTATTMMMFPIASSVIHVVRENHRGQARHDHFALSIMLSIAYASNFGGIATIIGTPPNVAFVGYIAERYQFQITFADWMMIAMPVSLLLLFSLYLVLTKFLFPNRLASDQMTQSLIRDELKKLGPLAKAEKRVLYIFLFTALLWIFKDLLNIMFEQQWMVSMVGKIKLDDTLIAITGALLMFMVASGQPGPGQSNRLLEWSDTSKMAWGILLLFGGGIALASALEKEGLIRMIGEWVAGFSVNGGFVLVLIITLLSLFISEVMSNIAQVIVFSPVIAGIADAMGIHPLLLGIPMALGASCASMLPMGTPPNAIVFASGHIRLAHMLKAGLVMNMIAMILIALFSWFLIPLIFPALSR